MTKASLITKKVVASDGRRQRTERTKEAIIEALFDLVSEGNLAPTAQQISVRAGIGLRTYFRRIKSLEALFKGFDERYRDELDGLIQGGNHEGTLDQRLMNAVEHFALVYELQKNVIRSTQIHLWHSEVVRKNYAYYQRLFKKNLEMFLPEVKALADDKRAAALGIVSFEMWQRLRQHQRLSKKKSIEVLYLLMKAILESR